MKTEYDKNKNNPDGLGARCKECRRLNDKTRWNNEKESEQIRSAKWRAENKEYLYIYEKGKKARVRYWPNLTNDEAFKEFEKLLLRQESKCAICNKHQSQFKKGLVIDHCHTTGKVRNLLCQNCNAMIGMAKEDENTLKNGIEYLKLHKMDGKKE